MREHIDISGVWRFQPDPNREGEDRSLWDPQTDVRRWREVQVPSCFEEGCPGLETYEGVCWYRRNFTVPPGWERKRVTLHFEAVNYRAGVWLNGAHLGNHTDPFLPFAFDITDALSRDRENVLVVRVDNRHHEGDVPGMHVGWRGYGGIIREVSVRATSRVYMDSVRVVATPDGSSGSVKLDGAVCNGGNDTAEVTVRAEVRDTAGTTLLTMSGVTRAGAGKSAGFSLQGVVKQALPWSPSEPVLYSLRLGLEIEGAEVDTQDIPFGFRRIAATPDGLLLNGNPVYLTGYNRHEDSPRTAMATDLDTVRRDLEQMKEAGANFVRLCHYPHHPAELDLCDRLGLLAFCEAPLYFWNDPDDGLRNNAARCRAAERQLRAMITRDRNHPSVAFWSVSNETSDNVPEVAESNRALIRAARELDPTRLCVHVSDKWQKHPNFDEDDVICVNWYPSIWHRETERKADYDLARCGGLWQDALAKLHGRYPGKPILVSEFGYCSLPGTFDHCFGEDVHARVIESEFAGMDAPYVCGATIWCWADHPWPPGRFFGGLSISPFGVLSRERRQLAPYWVARKLFRERQGMAEPKARSGDGKAGAEVRMIRPDLSDIPDVQLPEGYHVRGMTTDDIGLWTDIERDAEPYLNIGDGTFRQEFGGDLGALPRRCFILFDPQGRGVGTASAWYDRGYRDGTCGMVHWIALRPSSQGKGLGKALLAFTMRTLAQWHTKCILGTQSKRIGAINLYLKFGFGPDVSDATSVQAWRELSKSIRHPLIENALKQER